MVYIRLLFAWAGDLKQVSVARSYRLADLKNTGKIGGEVERGFAGDIVYCAVGRADCKRVEPAVELVDGLRPPLSG